MTTKNKHTEDLRIRGLQRLITPAKLKAELPLSDALVQQIIDQRQAVRDIIDRKDPRLLTVIGPCSIHDPVAALDYAQRLKVVADQTADRLFIVMRVYFEKPRTTTGWKGFINDPRLDDSCDMGHGLQVARQLLYPLLMNSHSLINKMKRI